VKDSHPRIVEANKGVRFWIFIPIFTIY
jgi:hypothetical protein